ncbi:MAG: PIN domain-containing protein [Planctomycetes bacterium]|nr:PIN domain-containing protein [Planctomycetota bacterium]
MGRRVLDSSVLIQHWHHSGGHPSHKHMTADAIAWGKRLAKIRGTNAILTPVLLEFLAGVTSENEMRLAQAYLDQFEVQDDRVITKQDCDEAERIARRVPRDGLRRQLGDCLIRAIANRLRCEVVSLDVRFPK